MEPLRSCNTDNFPPAVDGNEFESQYGLGEQRYLHLMNLPNDDSRRQADAALNQSDSSLKYREEDDKKRWRCIVLRRKIEQLRSGQWTKDWEDFIYWCDCSKEWLSSEWDDGLGRRGWWKFLWHENQEWQPDELADHLEFILCGMGEEGCATETNTDTGAPCQHQEEPNGHIDPFRFQGPSKPQPPRQPKPQPPAQPRNDSVQEVRISRTPEALDRKRSESPRVISANVSIRPPERVPPRCHLPSPDKTPHKPQPPVPNSQPRGAAGDLVQECKEPKELRKPKPPEGLPPPRPPPVCSLPPPESCSTGSTKDSTGGRSTSSRGIDTPVCSEISAQPRTQLDSCSEASTQHWLDGSAAQRWLDSSPQRGFEYQSPAKSTSSCSSGISDGFWPRSLNEFDSRREKMASCGTELDDPWSDLCDDRSKKHSPQDYSRLKRQRAKIPRDHPEQPSGSGCPDQPSSHNAQSQDGVLVLRHGYPDQPSSLSAHSQDGVVISRHRSIFLEPVATQNSEPAFAPTYEEEVIRRRSFHPLNARQLCQIDGGSLIPLRTSGDGYQETIDLHLRIPEGAKVNSPWTSYRIDLQR